MVKLKFIRKPKAKGGLGIINSNVINCTFSRKHMETNHHDELSVTYAKDISGHCMEYPQHDPSCCDSPMVFPLVAS